MKAQLPQTHARAIGRSKITAVASPGVLAGGNHFYRGYQTTMFTKDDHADPVRAGQDRAYLHLQSRRDTAGQYAQAEVMSAPASRERSTYSRSARSRRWLRSGGENYGSACHINIKGKTRFATRSSPLRMLALPRSSQARSRLRADRACRSDMWRKTHAMEVLLA